MTHPDESPAFALAEKTLMELCSEEEDAEVRLAAAQSLYIDGRNLYGGLNPEEQERLEKLEKYLEGEETDKPEEVKK